MIRIRALLCGLVLSGLAGTALAKDRVREFALALPMASPVAVDVRVPQAELAIEGNEVDADLFGGGLLGWAIASNKNEKRQAQAADAAGSLREATRGHDFAGPVLARLQPALAGQAFPAATAGQALVGDAAALADGAPEARDAGRLTVAYRYALTADYRYLRITMVAVLPATGGTANAYANKFTYFDRLPELVDMKGSATRAQAWSALGAERFNAMVDRGMATLGDALVYDLGSTGAAAGGKKMIYHERAQGVLGEARTETEVDGFDLGRHKDGSIVVMPRTCMQKKCWSIFSTD